MTANPVAPTLGSAQFLVSTERGLSMITRRGVVPLLDGEFYGITQAGRDWYAFRRQANRGHIVRFRVSGARLTHLITLEDVLSPGCQQIDFIGDRLCIADVDNNAVLVCYPDAEFLNPTRRYYPRGERDPGRPSANFLQITSLWSNGEKIFALFHDPAACGGKAEVVQLTSEIAVEKRWATTAARAHNLLLYGGSPLYCDSEQGQLVWGTKPVFTAGSQQSGRHSQCKWFTRGLSVTQDRILVGGSTSASTGPTSESAGAVFVLDSNFGWVGKIEVPGAVRELRCVNEADFGLSGIVQGSTGRRPCVTSARLAASSSSGYADLGSVLRGIDDCSMPH